VSGYSEHHLEHFQVKWTRFTVENAANTKTRADSTQVKTALGIGSRFIELACVPRSQKRRTYEKQQRQEDQRARYLR
jgi:hypothetical protein